MQKILFTNKTSSLVYISYKAARAVIVLEHRTDDQLRLLISPTQIIPLGNPSINLHHNLNPVTANQTNPRRNPRLEPLNLLKRDPLHQQREHDVTLDEG